MSKADNLTDFLTDVADAIRAKKGTSAKISPQDFSSEIASIEGVAGGGTVEKTDIMPKDVTFYDYDGTVLYSYSYDEVDGTGHRFDPPYPVHKGLTCQGWSNVSVTFPDRIPYGCKDSGAMYITDDGKTRLYIRIYDYERLTVPLYFTQDIDNGVTIDWGDGSATETMNGTGNKNTAHTYTAIGEYVITLKPTEKCTLKLGRSTSYNIFGASSDKTYRALLRKVEIGKNVTEILGGTFYYCHQLESITIPQGVTAIGSNAFGYCYSLRHITIPDGLKTIGTYAFQYCYGLQSTSLYAHISSIGSYAFYYCTSMSNAFIGMPNAIQGHAFQECFSLRRLTIDASYAVINTYAFRNAYSLTHVVLNCSTIDTYAFNTCSSLQTIDFSPCESIPTLANTNAFTSIPTACQMVVPDALYDTWIKATNWTTYASYIIKKSDYDAPNG